MKKVLSILLSLSFVALMAVSMPCFAEEMQGQMDVNVSAKFVNDVKNGYKSEVKDNKATANLTDGTKVEVKGLTQNNISLVVIPVEKNDSEAYSWFEEALKEYGTNIHPLDIYFVDSNGNRAEVTDNMVITVTIPDGFKNPIICYTDTDGNTTVLDSTINGNTITFTTNHNSFYSIVEKNVDSANQPASDKEDLPKTGQVNSMIYLLMILAVSGGAIAINLIIKKHRKHAKD